MITEDMVESSPVLDIEVFECKACGPKADDLGYRRPLNSLEGRIHLSSKSELHLSHLEVSFQGSQSTVVVAYRSNSNDIVMLKNADRFLNISYRLNLESVRKTERLEGSYIYGVDYSFVIPQGANYFSRELPPQCQWLPPSIEAVECSMNSYDQKLRPRAGVIYDLHASIGYREANAADNQSLKTIKATKQVDFLPYTEVQPPTNTASFPSEFIMHVASPIWKNPLGGRIGTISMTTREPVPLAYASATSTDSTDCVLALSVDASPGAIQRLRTLSLAVKSAVRAKTFYSAESIPCLPKQTSLTQRGTLRFHDGILKLEQQEFQNLEWEYVPKILQEESPPRYEDAVSQDNCHNVSGGSVVSNGKVGFRRWVSSSPNTTTEDTNGTWCASVRIPIAPLQTLLPTFCSKLVARSYTVLICVVVAGINTKRANFEVPLQVVHLPPWQLVDTLSNPPEDSSPCLGAAALLAQDSILPAYDALPH